MRSLKAIRRNITNAVRVFATKDGEYSKTAVFLSLGLFLLLVMWAFQSLFAGVVFLGWWTVPEFSVGTATSVVATLYTGYLINHKVAKRPKGAELLGSEISCRKETQEEVLASVDQDGEENDN